jgi:ABC-type nitrate/sulfonate/bicarbonate transport system permease component
VIKFLQRYPFLVSLPVLAALWASAVNFGWIGKSLLAGPGEVIGVLERAFHPATHSASIYGHALATISRAFAGWSIALVLGGAIGLVLGLNATIYRATESLFEFARAIPPIMAFPLLLVAFDFGAPAYVWTIAIGSAPIMVLTVARGIRALDHTRLELLAVHGAPPALRIVAAVIEVLPAAFLGARLTFSISLIVAVVTEMVFSPRSGYALGALAKDSQISFDTPTFYACIFILGVYGYAANAALHHAELWLSDETRRAA